MRTCHAGSRLPRSWARQGVDTIRRPRDLDGAGRPPRSLIVRGLPCDISYRSSQGCKQMYAHLLGGRAFFCIRLAHRVGIEIGRPAHHRGCAACCCIRTAHRGGLQYSSISVGSKGRSTCPESAPLSVASTFTMASASWAAGTLPASCRQCVSDRAARAIRAVTRRAVGGAGHCQLGALQEALALPTAWSRPHASGRHAVCYE